MASLPHPRQSSQRRPSPEETSQPAASPVGAQPATPDDSRTLFGGRLAKQEREEQQQPQQPQHQDEAAPGAAQPYDADFDPDVKKCWICFADSTEDTPETSPWRNPCPCALVAHEECLLDWIADMEAPTSSRNRSIGAPRIECPQCKAEIKLARPRNYVVEAVRGLERIGARAIMPGALTILSATVWNSSLAWGAHSIYAIFGPDDGFRILRPLILNTTRPPVEVYVGEPREAVRKMVGVVLDHLVHWRLYVGLPLITPVLVLSRTRWADSVLPVLPILFFATQAPALDDGLDSSHWPPSASLAFAVLPYIRSAYNAYHERVWAEKEKQWLAEIQPRSGQGQNDTMDEPGQAALEEIAEEGAPDDNVFEVRIDGGIWEEWEEDPGQPQPDAQLNRVAPPLQQPPLHDGEPQAHPPPDAPDNRPPAQFNAQQPPQHQQHPHQPQQVAGGERRLSFSPTAIAETVLGALIFPTIAGMSGELLKLILPRSWTTPPVSSTNLRGLGRLPAKGLLQEKWGRSLIGGCLFVVAKDAIMLYVRWRMAQMHRRRRVLDYDKPKRR